MKTIFLIFLALCSTSFAQRIVLGGTNPEHPVSDDGPGTPIDPRYFNGPGKFMNLSTRAEIHAPSHPVTAGLVVKGGGRSVLVRAVGTGLLGFGVESPLLAPTLTIRRSNGDVVTKGIPFKDLYFARRSEIHEVEQTVGAFPLKDDGSDIAVVLFLTDGVYTCSVDSKSGGGTVLVEVYDIPEPDPEMPEVPIESGS